MYQPRHLHLLLFFFFALFTLVSMDEFRPPHVLLEPFLPMLRGPPVSEPSHGNGNVSLLEQLLIYHRCRNFVALCASSK